MPRLGIVLYLRAKGDTSHMLWRWRVRYLAPYVSVSSRLVGESSFVFCFAKLLLFGICAASQACAAEPFHTSVHGLGQSLTASRLSVVRASSS